MERTTGVHVGTGSIKSAPHGNTQHHIYSIGVL